VLDVERAFVAAATAGAPLPRDPHAAGAVASRYLAVGTPRSFAIVGDGARSLEAHRTWFAPRDIRSTRPMDGARLVTLAEALAADIVCIHEPVSLTSTQLRRGTHVNALAPVELDPELDAWIVDDRELAAIAAGLVDGRQLDELTIYISNRSPAATARSAPRTRDPSP
jgi:hypothetical protein